MVWNRKLLYVASVVGAGAIFAPFLVSKSLAQDVAQPPGGGAQMRQFQPMMGGGGVAMIADGDFLFILQGNRLMKVKKSDLSIVTEKPLRAMQPPGGGDRGGLGGAGGGGLGGPGGGGLGGGSAGGSGGVRY